jgi:hypothetical protein
VVFYFGRRHVPIVQSSPVVAVSPDAGSSERAAHFHEELQALIEQDVASAFMEKTRSAGP